MILRRPKKDEFEYYAEFEKDFYKHHASFKTFLQDKDPKKRALRKEFNELLRRKDFFRFIIIDDEIVGYINGFIDDPGTNRHGWKRMGVIDSVFIKKGYRRFGLGKKAIKEFFKWLKEKEVPYVKAICNINNKAVIKMNQELGLKQQHMIFGKKL